MVEVKKQGLQIDGIAASSAIDTSSESIDIENLDISSLQAGHGVFLVEHKKPKDEKAGYQDVLGAVTFAKKIFSAEDCDDDRQLAYWNQIELPFCYIRGELFDADGHEGAKAAASIIRFYHRNKMPIVLRFSIDGQTIEREGNVLKYCIARDVAITLKPCNQSCVSGVIEPGKAKTEAPFDELSRSEEGLHRYAGVSFEMQPLIEIEETAKSEEVDLPELSKGMTAGGGGGSVAPGALVGGAALGKEDVMFKSRVKAAFRDWNRREPLMAHMTKSLPDAHPDFLTKFVDLVAENRLRKASELHEHLEKAIGDMDKTGVHAPKPEDLAADAKKTPTGTVKTAVGGNSSGNMKENQKPQNDTPLLPHQTPEHRKATMAAVNAELAAKNPEAAKLQSTPPPLPPPHVPGLRVGMTPEQGAQRDAAVAAPVLPHQTPLSRAVAMQQINNDIAMRNPEARQLQAMKSEEVFDEDSLEKAIADILPGKETGNFTKFGDSPEFDYSHLIADSHPGAKILLHHHPLNGGGSLISAHAVIGGQTVGHVDGFVGDRTVGPKGKIDIQAQPVPGAPTVKTLNPHSNVDKEFRGQGLGKALYSAVFKHAQSVGVTHVAGDGHSIPAQHVHASLAAQHGMQYTPGRGKYTYALKSEGDLVKDEEPTVPEAAPAKAPKPKKEPRLTIGGLPAPAAKRNLKEPHFDEQTGTMHTEKGSFPVYIPSQDTAENRDSFHNILNSPAVNKFHDYAVDNWSRLHAKLKDGQLPAPVIMHAVLFSQLSPNTPVPMQELMYGHLVDHMKDTGVDATSPAFGATKEGWMNRSSPEKFPDISPDHWEAHQNQLRIKNDSEMTGRKAGEIGGFMLANDKWKNMSRYHEIHDRLVDTVNRHKTDARSAVRELMAGKAAKNGFQVPGLAQKTARYTMGMLGGGNVMVPDTHFVRYLFGLDKGKDMATIKHLKDVLWRSSPGGTAALEGLDRYYFRHHDAVQHMLNHPKHGKLFQDNPESSIFPAFWKNWVSIVPHEKARGLTSSGFNESTDHKPFWDAVHPFVKSEDIDPQWAAAMRTAELHRKWADEYGETPAMMLYLHYLVPHLMNLGGAPVAKSEPSTEAAPAMMPEKPKQEILTLKDAKVKPGILAYRAGIGHETAGTKHRLVGEDEKNFHVIPMTGSDYRISLVPKDLEHKAYDVVEPWKPATSKDSKVSVDHLSHHSRSPEQVAMATKINVAAKHNDVGSHHDVHARFGRPPWKQRGAGSTIFIKPNSPLTNQNLGQPAAIKETSFHNLARDFFGAGDMVPTTASFFHPENGELHSAQEFVRGARHVAANDPVLNKLHANGSTPKAAVMDYIFGHGAERHQGNFLVTKDNKLKLIDNGGTAGYRSAEAMPSYVPYGQRDAAFTPETESWVKSLDPAKLGQRMLAEGMTSEQARHATTRLQALHQRLARGEKLTYRNMIISHLGRPS